MANIEQILQLRVWHLGTMVEVPAPLQPYRLEHTLPFSRASPTLFLELYSVDVPWFYTNNILGSALQLKLLLCSFPRRPFRSFSGLWAHYTSLDLRNSLESWYKTCMTPSTLHISRLQNYYVLGNTDKFCCQVKIESWEKYFFMPLFLFLFLFLF